LYVLLFIEQVSILYDESITNCLNELAFILIGMYNGETTDIGVVEYQNQLQSQKSGLKTRLKSI
jgi:hypothetical protein